MTAVKISFMKWLAPILLSVLAACATEAVVGVVAPASPAGRVGQQQETASVARGRPAVAATVIESIIQRDRVVVTLDRGTANGIRPGMSGSMANGRPFKVISADERTCRVVVIGLNLRFATGSDALIYR